MSEVRPNDPATLREFTCGWKYFDPLDQTAQRGFVKVKAVDIQDAIVHAKKAVFTEHGLPAQRVNITTIEEDFL